MAGPNVSGTCLTPMMTLRYGGSHAAVFTAPPGTLVTLRTSAADAAGGTVTGTIISAYRTGP
jgi:hypothetical protein